MRPLACILCALLAGGAASGPGAAQSPEALAAPLLSGAADPAEFDYGAVRFAGDADAGWAALQAIDDHAQAMVPEALKTGRPFAAFEVGCDVNAILSGLRLAKLAPDYAAYADAREAAAARIRALTPEADARAERASAAADPGLARRLARAAADDLAWRDALEDRTTYDGLGDYAAEMLLTGLAQKACEADTRSADLLAEVLDGPGWITRSAHGAQAGQDAWTIAQHASLPMQVEILERFETLLPAGEVSQEHYAFLYDRVAVKQGRPQRFGTQGTCLGGAWSPDPVEDPQDLDTRRAEMGMPPMAGHAAAVSAKCP